VHGSRILRSLRNLKHRHGTAQALRLDFQRGSGGRSLLDHGGVFLRGPFDVGHRVIHRRNARRLFGRGAGNFGNDLRHAVHRHHHVAHGVARQVHLTHARLDARGRVFDQALDFFGGLRAALRQRAHFARHDGKAFALFAGTRRFHRRVQRQDVGLKGNAVDHAHDLADAARAVGNTLHALHDLVHRLPAALGQLGGAFGLPAGQVGIACRHLHRVRQLRHIGGGLLQRTGLARGTVGHVCPARGDFARARVDFFNAMAYRGHRRRQARLHAAHGGIQHADFVVAARGDGAGQVAVGDPVEVRTGFVQRTQNAAAKRQADQHGQQQHQPQHTCRHENHALQRLAGARHGRLALVTRIGLISVRLLHIRRTAHGQRLVHQPIHFDPVPALDGLLHGGQCLVGKRGVSRQHLFKQRPALLAGVRVAAQPRQAGCGLLQQRIRLRQGLIARVFQAAFHAGLGVRQRGARLEQAAGHVGQVAGPFDAAPAQGLDVGAVVAQDGDAGSGRYCEQHHKQRQNGGNRRGDPEIFTHIHPCVAWRLGAVLRIMDTQFGNFLTQPGRRHDERRS